MALARAEVALLEDLLRLGEGLRDLGGTLVGTPLALQALDEGLDLALGQSTHEAVDHPAAGDREDGGDRLHAELLGDLGVLVDVDLGEAQLALGLAHHLLEQGAKLLAGPAPGRPQIDDHRDLARGLDHVGHEASGGDILDERRLSRIGGGSRYLGEGLHGLFSSRARA